MTTRRRLIAVSLAALALPRGAWAAEPVKVAFVDTGNTGRSLMAEHLARTMAARDGLRVAVISRGLDVDSFDEAPEPNAKALLAERGVDVAGHVARSLTAGDVAHADVVLTMTAAHLKAVVARYPTARGKAFTLAAYATGEAADVPDAWGKPLADYRAVLAQLDRYLPLALAKAAAAAPST